MHIHCWADDLDLEDLQDARKKRHNEWMLDVNEISVHTCRKFPFTYRTDTLLVTLMRISKSQWEALPLETRARLLTRVASLMHKRYAVKRVNV